MGFPGLQIQLPLAKGNLTETPCSICPAICCQYFALQIDTPKCKHDFENIRWYLMHDRVNVFLDDGKWYLQVWSRCENLLPDNRCGVYETRPQICRDYGLDADGRANCHATSKPNHEYEVLFTTAEQIEKYYKKWYTKRYGKRNSKATGKNHAGRGCLGS